MDLKYVLDTSTVSRAYGPQLDPLIVARFGAANDEMAVPSVAWHELLFGMERLPESARKERLRRFLENVVRGACAVLPYDEAAAEWHARERARLERIGRPAPFQDGQIAATAATNGLTLVTANVRDFSNFEGLSIEDWSSPQR